MTGLRKDGGRFPAAQAPHIRGDLPSSGGLRTHTDGCAHCKARLYQMIEQAADFSRSSHSLPARQVFHRADRRWRTTAMLLALVPTLAAALALAEATPGLRLVIDLMHVFRSGSTAADPAADAGADVVSERGAAGPA